MPNPSEMQRQLEEEQDDLAQYRQDVAAAREFIKSRAEALGWYSSHGKLSKKGGEAALDALIGFNAGLTHATGGERSVCTICFLAAVRGVQDMLLDKE